MFPSFKAVATLSAVLYTVLAEARYMVPYNSPFIDANCEGSTVAVNVLGVCACVDILKIPFLAVDCPDCNEPNALSESVCVGLSIGGAIVSAGVGVCGCECDADSYAVLGIGKSYCYKTSGCSGAKGTIKSFDAFGYKTCTCNTGYTFSDGECKLNASLKSRQRTRKSTIVNEASDAFRCPDSEAACAIGNGYECIDTTSSLDSCGGCLNNGGVNCLAIPGALGVSCIDSQCILSSCFPGWSLINGKCVEVEKN